jgi:hypothetical protein
VAIEDCIALMITNRYAERLPRIETQKQLYFPQEKVGASQDAGQAVHPATFERRHAWHLNQLEKFSKHFRVALKCLNFTAKK